MTQLNMEEREVISQMFAAGHSRQAIAERLRRPCCTIAREVRRNARDDGSYSAVDAQRKAETRRRERPLIRKLERPELNAVVRAYLTQEWSPDQIAGRLKVTRAGDPQFHV